MLICITRIRVMFACSVLFHETEMIADSRSYYADNAGLTYAGYKGCI